MPDGEDLECPRCGQVVEDGISHGQTETCPACRLVMTRYGNALQIKNMT